MNPTPYRLTLIALRLMAVFCFVSPALKLIGTIGVFLGTSVHYGPDELAWGNLIYAATVPFIPPLVLAWVVWRISPRLARFIVAPLKAEDEEGTVKPTPGEIAWKERQEQMKPAPKKPPGSEGGNKGWMAT